MKDEHDVETMPLDRLLRLSEEWAASPAPLPPISGKLALRRFVTILNSLLRAGVTPVEPKRTRHATKRGP